MTRKKSMNRLLISAILLAFLISGGCSDEEARQQLRLGVERLVLEHDRFAQDIDRYHQERQRLKERAIGLIAAVFVSALLADGGEAALSYEATRIAYDEQDFAPEAKRLYREGQRIAEELKRLYELRDELAADDQRLYQERQRLAQDLDQIHQTVDSIKQEFLQAQQAYDQIGEAYLQASQAWIQWKQENRHIVREYNQAASALDQAKRKKARAASALGRLKKEWEEARDRGLYSRTDRAIAYHIKGDYAEAYQVHHRASKAEKEAEKVYNRKAELYLHNPLLKTFTAAEDFYKATEQVYNQKYNRLEQDLERTYLDWAWLKPYIDRLVRDIK